MNNFQDHVHVHVSVIIVSVIVNFLWLLDNRSLPDFLYIVVKMNGKSTYDVLLGFYKPALLVLDHQVYLLF